MIVTVSYFDANYNYCVCNAVIMANICLWDSFIKSVLRCCFGTFTWGADGGWDSSFIAAGMQQAGSQGNYRESTSIPCQDAFLFVSVYALCVLPGRSLCGLVFTYLPVLPVQLKASGCLPNTDRRPLMQPPMTGQPSSCHWPQRSPTPNTHTSELLWEFRETTYRMLTSLCEITNFRLYGVKQKKEKFIEMRSTLMLFSFRLIIPLIQLISAPLTHR